MDMDSDKPLLPRPTQSPQAQPRRGTQVHQPSSRLSNVTDVTEDSDTVRYGLSTTSSTFTFEKCYERVGLDVSMDWINSFWPSGSSAWPFGPFWLTFKELILL